MDGAKAIHVELKKPHSTRTEESFKENCMDLLLYCIIPNLHRGEEISIQMLSVTLLLCRLLLKLPLFVQQVHQKWTLFFAHVSERKFSILRNSWHEFLQHAHILVYKMFYLQSIQCTFFFLKPSSLTKRRSHSFEAEGQRGVTQKCERDSSRTGKNAEMWPRLVHKVQCQQSKWILLLPSVAVCGAVWHGFMQLSYTNTCLATRAISHSTPC